MDRRTARLTGVLFLIIVALVLGFGFYALFKRKLVGGLPPQVRAEFWIYTAAEDRPDDKKILERLVGNNPHHKKGNPPVGASEGMTFSDVRFGTGVIRRERNALLFRPEVFAELDAEIRGAISADLDEARTVVTVKFISETEPIRGPGYLQFVTHVVDAVAEMTDAALIWDVEAQQFYSREELFSLLQQDPDATRFDLQVSVRWSDTAEEGRAFTRGMAKMGLPDIALSRQPLDQKVLALFLVEEAARMCWTSRAIQPWEINGFGEDFVVIFDEPKPGSSTHRGWLSEMHAGRKRPIPAA